MTDKTIYAIDTERQHQEKKFPGHRHTQGEYLLILRKLLGDADRAWYHDHNNHACLSEIRQIAAVCVKAMEEHGAPPRDSVVVTVNNEPKAAYGDLSYLQIVALAGKSPQGLYRIGYWHTKMSDNGLCAFATASSDLLPGDSIPATPDLVLSVVDCDSGQSIG